MYNFELNKLCKIIKIVADLIRKSICGLEIHKKNPVSAI